MNALSQHPAVLRWAASCQTDDDNALAELVMAGKVTALPAADGELQFRLTERADTADAVTFVRAMAARVAE